MDHEKNTPGVPAPADGDYAVKSEKKYTLIAKILCVIAAFLVWLYAANNDTSLDDKTFTSLPITVVNSSDSMLSVYSGFESTLDITVTGKRAEIRNLRESDIYATVDISEITEAGRYKLPVEVDLPGGIEIIDRNIDTLSLYIDNRTSVTVPVTVKMTNTVIVSGYELGKEILDRDTITVTGPEAVLETIDRAQLSVSLGRVNTSMTYTGPVVLLDESGQPVENPYVRTDVSDVTVKFPVYLTKDIPLSVNYKNGLWNQSNVQIHMTPETVRVRGEVEEVEALTSVVLATLDEKQLGVYDSTLLNLPLDLDDRFENLDQVSTVAVQINQTGTTMRSLPISSFQINNPDELDYKLITNSITVTLRAPNEYANQISNALLTCKLDLSKLAGTAGVVAVPVEIEIIEPYRNLVYEVGEYTVWVEMGQEP